MTDKTKAILEITAPDGQEFVDKGAIVNQTTGLNGVCIELYIPTKAIEEQQKTHHDTLTMTLTPPNGYAFDDVLEFNPDLSSAYITEDFYAKAWFEIKLKPIKKNPMQDLAAQAEVDKKAYPDAWANAWQYRVYDGKGGLDWDTVIDSNHILSKTLTYRRHPHADIIMQCEQDKIDYPEFWSELVQWKCKTELTWRNYNTTHNDFDCENYDYRLHPRRKSIIQFNRCNEADKKRWQCMEDGFESFGWHQVEGVPMWFENHKYRLRPRVCFITLQDGTKMEFPEPVREALKRGQEYFLVNPLSGTVDKFNWSNEFIEKGWLSRNFIHLNQEAAEQHLSALQAMNAQVAL